MTPADVSVPIPPIAYALVNSHATIIRSTAGVTVTSIATGNFCVHFPAGVVTGHEIANVAPEFSGSPTIDISAQWDASATNCPSGSELVATFNGADFAAEGFTISVS